MLELKYIPLLLISFIILNKLVVDIVQRFVGEKRLDKLPIYKDLIIILLTFGIVKFFKVSLADIGFLTIGVSDALRAIGYGLLTSIILFILMMMIVTIIPDRGGNKDSKRKLSFRQTVLSNWCLRSFTDELFYRALFISFLMPTVQYSVSVFGYPLSFAILFPAILYSLNHLSLNNRISSPYVISKMVSSFGIAIVAGKLYLETGSIISAYLVHLMFNIVGTVTPLILGKVVYKLKTYSDKKKETNTIDD